MGIVVLQIRRGEGDNYLGIIFLIVPLKRML